MRHALILAPLLLMGAQADAFAQDDRYVLEKSGGGFVRMDRDTGEMALCTTEDGNLVCKMSADQRQAYEDEIDRLQTSLDSLEDRVAKLESSPPSGLQSQLPSEEEFKTTLSYMERFLRTFMGVVKDMDADKPAPADPDRT